MATRDGVPRRVGRPSLCGGCGHCERCERAAYMRAWWAARTTEQKRAAVAKRDPERLRAGDREKMRKRRAVGTPEQKQRIAARQAVSHARQSGKLTRGPCEYANEGGGCGGPIHAHHEDYAKPLEVRWLCRTHHEREHACATI